MSASARTTTGRSAGTGSACVALVRGINVGGRNAVRMAELIDAFRDADYDEVSTYLQSGNVLFRADAGPRELETEVEAMLERRLGVPLLVVIRSKDEFAATIDAAPAGHGSPDLRSDVIFLKHPLSAEEALSEFPELRDGVDAVAAGPGAIYFSRVAVLATKTRIQRLMAMPIFERMTMRSWRTCVRLHERLDGM
ncbi:DUF1697 domain-containing protein [Agromyces aurantiacus]|uniref:DUF1697 domain-containing protein n=1 Tax=Agromyces aurantiacus TaxID=165814 RepID=A0ABV9R5J6_9MICO|nr:DUF1697 domain-containing protein [Agromyces aurantiacus]MBM7505938.1 uncharacterized protein (DUF1697 family) [Agromyces aurantiacus]